jgi:hypothetical protein
MNNHTKPPDIGEDEFLESLDKFMVTSMKSPRRDIATAAREWRRKIAFRIALQKQAISIRKKG